jgi:hypothetical protein
VHKILNAKPYAQGRTAVNVPRIRIPVSPAKFCWRKSFRNIFLPRVELLSLSRYENNRGYNSGNKNGY